MKELIDIAEKEQKKRYPNVPEFALPKPKYTDKTANGLTKAIIDFLRLKGWQAERISVKRNNCNRTFLPYLNRLKDLEQVITLNSN